MKEPIPAEARRAVAAGLFGTAVEYYEFTIYGLLTLAIAANFFSTQDGTTAVLATLLTFGSSYLVRPLGAIFFGWYGDKFGRRAALILAISIMGTASTAIGLLPGYATLGAVAPILLVLARLCQGFSAGGELIGAVTYVMESVPPSRRGFLVAMNPFGSSMGAATGSVVVGIISLAVTAEQLTAWGWRIPFLLCLPLTVICLVLRLRVEDSPEFRKAVETSTIRRVPLRQLFTQYPKQMLQALGFGIGLSGVVYVSLVYAPAFLVKTRGFDQRGVFWLIAACLVIQAVSIPLFGMLGDRFGRRPVLIAGTLGHLVLAFPILLLLANAPSFAAVGLTLLLFMLLSGVQSSGLVLFSELFPVRVRYTGAALSYNLAAVIAGGFSPYIATLLVASTGSPTSPAWWIIGVSVIGLIALFSIRETAYGRSDRGAEEKVEPVADPA
ncbi:MFS transporter [Pseudonocardia xishanensis]|uniref:MFS transporter n=1 Tax=Pseudonocardia xishanensis TaxID=630995 RepID=A0ABP8RTH3_9PSEU